MNAFMLALAMIANGPYIPNKIESPRNKDLVGCCFEIEGTSNIPPQIWVHDTQDNVLFYGRPEWDDFKGNYKQTICVCGSDLMSDDELLVVVKCNDTFRVIRVYLAKDCPCLDAARKPIKHSPEPPLAKAAVPPSTVYGPSKDAKVECCFYVMGSSLSQPTVTITDEYGNTLSEQKSPWDKPTTAFVADVCVCGLSAGDQITITVTNESGFKDVRTVTLVQDCPCLRKPVTIKHSKEPPLP